MRTRLNRLGRDIWDARYIYLLLIPGLLYFIIFHYVPMNGVVLAFKKYNARLGIWGSASVGWANFERIFRTPGGILVSAACASGQTAAAHVHKYC